MATLGTLLYRVCEVVSRVWLRSHPAGRRREDGKRYLHSTAMLFTDSHRGMEVVYLTVDNSANVLLGILLGIQIDGFPSKPE
jgi:hypothetical protein